MVADAIRVALAASLIVAGACFGLLLSTDGSQGELTVQSVDSADGSQVTEFDALSPRERAVTERLVRDGSVGFEQWRLSIADRHVLTLARVGSTYRVGTDDSLLWDTRYVRTEDSLYGYLVDGTAFATIPPRLLLSVSFGLVGTVIVVRNVDSVRRVAGTLGRAS